MRLPHLTVFYDNGCLQCTRFSLWVKKWDTFKKINLQDLRNNPDIEQYKGLDKEKAAQKMASFNGNTWCYGFDSLYAIARRIPVCLPLLPFLFLLKISRAGNILYHRIASHRTEKCPIAPKPKQ